MKIDAIDNLNSSISSLPVFVGVGSAEFQLTPKISCMTESVASEHCWFLIATSF
jgi:hypothetical protein